MFLKKLIKNGSVTVNYYENGSLQTFKGRVYNFNLHEQTLSLKNEKQNIFLFAYPVLKIFIDFLCLISI